MKKVFWSGVLILALVFSTSASAAPNMVISGDVIPEGGTAVVSMTFQQDGVVTDLSFDLDYDETQFTATTACVGSIPTVGNSATVLCDLVDLGGGDMVVRVAVLPVFANPIPEIAAPDPSLGTISFANIGGTTGTFPLAFVPLTETYFDAKTGAQVSSTGSILGEIEVQGAVYQGTPSGLNTMSVIQGQVDPTGSLAIENIGAQNTTLTGTCAVTTNDTVFSVESGSPFSVLAGASAATVVVSCDSDATQTTHNGELTCTPSGDNAPAVYPLVCQVTDGPQPVFKSAPLPGSNIQMMAVFEGDAIANENIIIDNDNGQVVVDPPLTSNLNGTCVISGDPEITLVAGGAFSIDAGEAAATQTLACDSSTSSFGNDFTALLTCTHNALGSPALYNIACDVGPKREAEFASDPSPGAEVDMTPGDVVTDEVIPDQTLTFSNLAPALSADLMLNCIETSNVGNISVSALTGTPIAPGGSTSVTFSCDSATAEDSELVYECDYDSVRDKGPDTDPAGSPSAGTATYTYSCDVRDAEAVVFSDPPSGTTLTEQVAGGGSATFNISFGVDPDEGVDGELVTCSMDDPNYQILSPASFPAAIPSDGTLVVSVQGNDPGGVETATGVLTCEYSDSTTPSTEWTYNLVMEIGSYATFRVTKNFTDDNPAEVRVELNCNNGLPVNQGFNISESQDVNFVLSSFSNGEPDCTITEVSVDGYATEYFASGESNPSYDTDGCYFDDVTRGDVNICNITNDVKPVMIEVTKEWFMEGTNGNAFEEYATVTVSSDSEIMYGNRCDDRGPKVQLGRWCQHLNFEGPETDTQSVMVYPAWDGVMVYIDENLVESYIDSENDCGGSVEIFPGDGASCTVTNTVFFEGIPTLNQYGMAIMALLMLGVGLLGFRRFV